ncbi:hypothetical protein KBY65_13345 [Cyanobium sp. Alchichica 3B3-8F6]|uniref:hypothetical protein n=1 Tax=Cyanobium sp. Alchichica 3B3-8F6 TaxID=2823696 RepID=UPI0020CF58BA|nr:hypothetical protein [Cyanobium sp. Alchichica 3B3-8F6]MCP9883440.1 hypothetical protein [Cyanobium sp. Alchichica 3B3-8F6]
MNPEEVISSDGETVRVSINLKLATLVWLDDLKEAFGLRSRTDVLNRLLEELMPKEEEESDPPDHLSQEPDVSD